MDFRCRSKIHRLHNIERTNAMPEPLLPPWRRFPRVHNTWLSMIQRCTNPKNTAYRNYGARGITVCARWRNSFEAFLADMGDRPEGKTLDRINNDGNYEPGNCRWATKKQQCRNSRKNRVVTVGTQTGCLSELAELFGQPQNRARKRLNAGWTPEQAFKAPRTARISTWGDWESFP